MKKETLFVGSREVDQIKVSSKLDLVGVLYKDGYNEDFTKAQWEDLKSEKAYSDGEIMVRKHEKLIKRIIKDMKECRVTMLEQEWILTRTNESVLHNYEEAVSKMFGVKNKNNIMLAVIDVALKN